jgi:hypothetical protein
MAVYRPKYRNPKTGELLESQVWWYDFSFAGQRIQKFLLSWRCEL